MNYCDLGKKRENIKVENKIKIWNYILTWEKT